MRGQSVEQERLLRQRFFDQSEVELFEVAKAAVDQLA